MNSVLQSTHNDGGCGKRVGKLREKYVKKFAQNET